MKVEIKFLNDGAKKPNYGSELAAAGDLYAVCDDCVTIEPGETAFIGTGIAVAIPEGYVGLVFARSGLSCKQGLAPANKVGVIDADYRGEIKVAIYNQSKEIRVIENGERIAQMMIVPFVTAEYELVEELQETVRGECGFGSTGTK